ncbi:MAG TPA: hypothetical protein VM941_13100 [Pyrinomonadaceae bacterium]|jgi:hypothetical protein|nr:hypothetical protein [Pyrinomonadaceae bacterium]
MFEGLTNEDTRGITLVKRVCLIVISVYLVIGLMALYRALVQVHSLEINSAETLRDHSAVTATVLSYGRTPVDLRIELVQPAHSETLVVKQVEKNEWALLDPRMKEATQTVVLSDNVLDRFADGKAVLRATVIGRLQLGHLPAPVVREHVVEIRRR